MTCTICDGTLLVDIEPLDDVVAVAAVLAALAPHDAFRQVHAVVELAFHVAFWNRGIKGVGRHKKGMGEKANLCGLFSLKREIGF